MKKPQPDLGPIGVPGWVFKEMANQMPHTRVVIVNEDTNEKLFFYTPADRNAAYSRSGEDPKAWANSWRGQKLW